MSSVAQGNEARREHISALLRRYPDILADELAELVTFYKTAPPLDTALLSCEPDVNAKSKQFLKDHAKATSRGIEAPWVVAIIAGLSIALFLAFALH